MQHLYLMRHGQSQANADQIVAGSHDSPLSATGVLQAEYAGETARLFFRFDLIVSSPMDRSIQTARIVARHIEYPVQNIIVMQNLRERDLGDVEGMNYAQAPQHNGNYEDAEDVRGVEPIEELFARAQEVLRDLSARPQQHILIVTHNGCGRMLKVALHNQPPLAMYDQPRTENAVIYQLS